MPWESRQSPVVTRVVTLTILAGTRFTDMNHEDVVYHCAWSSPYCQEVCEYHCPFPLFELHIKLKSDVLAKMEEEDIAGLLGQSIQQAW